MIATACGAPGQRQRLRQRNKSIDISLYSGWDELTSTPTRDHDLEHQKFSLCSPRSEAKTEKLKKRLTNNIRGMDAIAVFRLRRPPSLRRECDYAMGYDPLA